MNPLFDPNIAYILVVLSLFMAVVTFILPGTGIPETITILLMIGAWWVISHLDVNTFALFVAVLGLIPVYLAFKRPAYQKVLLAVSALMLIGGSVYLFTDKNGRPLVDIWLAVIVSILFLLFIWLLITRGARILNKRSVLDPDTPVGKLGEARSDIDLKGSVYVNGEMWTARSVNPISQGSAVRVLDREGFVLTVIEEEKQ